MKVQTTLPQRWTSSDQDADNVGQPPAAVRVAVLNQSLQLAPSMVGSRLSWLRTASLISGISESEPGLNLLVLSGFGPWHGGPDHLEFLGEACRSAGVWTVVRTGGDRPGMALLDQDGCVVLRHSDVHTGSSTGRVVDGPGGLRTGLAFIGTTGALVNDAGLRGAELVVALRVAPAPTATAIQVPTRALAWTQSCFVATANACGSVGSHRWVGWSLIAGFDGQVLASCQDLESEIAIADLHPEALRQARRKCTRSGLDARWAMHQHRLPAR